ncbi:DUF4160 domain-containing protein [Oxalicibacterium solurbis]|uniref:DUF4160 domain-containing protein n=1 Tax=Oxalicibacterium solurbis TaxID=69280 RepID=A0A8J3F4R0_9BURK|nr:DUF4160 domain-containing protein [Oxalicibacterium solurbis]GGI53299.1 hypothetical protein GCM10011430_04730 [Oxalicibacterium solurbis]
MLTPIEQKILETQSLEEATAALEHLLSGGYSVTPDGQIYYIRQLVAQVKGLRIEIFSREHPPPHFHVSGGGIDATFSIADCSLQEGKIGGRERALIEWWFERSRPILVSAWNATRPSDCPVGPITL